MFEPWYPYYGRPQLDKKREKESRVDEIYRKMKEVEEWMKQTRKELDELQENN